MAYILPENQERLIDRERKALNLRHLKFDPH